MVLLWHNSFLVCMVQSGSSCPCWFDISRYWGITSSTFGVFDSKQLTDWISFRGLNVSFVSVLHDIKLDVFLLEVSVPVPTLVFDDVLIWVRFSLTMFWSEFIWVWLYVVPSLVRWFFKCEKYISVEKESLTGGKELLELVRGGRYVVSFCPPWH